MGWNASALRNGERLAIASRYSPDYWSVDDLPLRAVFEDAAHRVEDLVGGAPEYLSAAGLSGTYDRIAFELAFGIRFSDVSAGVLEWSAVELRERSANAQWNVPDDEIEVYSYWTVKEFVAVCVQTELGQRRYWPFHKVASMPW